MSRLRSFRLREFAVLAAWIGFLLTTAGTARAQQTQYLPGAGPQRDNTPDTLSVEVHKLAPWVYAAKVRYVWTGWVELPDGILVIDSAMDDSSATALADTIAARSGQKPIKYLVNTHAHEDHYGGNQVFLAKGATLIAQAHAAAKIDSVMAHAAATTAGSRIVKPAMRVDKKKVLGSGDRKVEIVWLGKNAHTNGDLVVWIPKYQIAFTGDLVSNRAVPWMLDPNMSRKGWEATLDTLVHRYRISTLIPGHGVFNATPYVPLKYTRSYLKDANDKAVETAGWGTHVASVKGWGQLGAYEDNEFYEEVHFMNMRRLYNEAKGKKTPGRPNTRAIKP